MDKLDKYHGHGGTYEFDPKTGERRLKEKPTEPAPQGGGARDKDGELLEKPAKDAKPEPALPAPGRAPWDAEPPPAVAPGDAAKKKGA